MALKLGQAFEVSLREPDLRSPVMQATRIPFVIDVTLAEPWFPDPAYGRRIPNIDGTTASNVATFESSGPLEILAPCEGRIQVQDSRLDVHTPLGFPNAGAGRGVELTLTHPSGIVLRFGHLERGSTPSLTTVKVGQALGRTGNTGRCLDGCGRTFVSVQQVKGPRDLGAPLKLRAFLGENRLTAAPVELPAGLVQISRVKLGSGKPERKIGKKTTILKVELLRGHRPLGTQDIELAVAL